MYNVLSVCKLRIPNWLKNHYLKNVFMDTAEYIFSMFLFILYYNHKKHLNEYINNTHTITNIDTRCYGSKDRKKVKLIDVADFALKNTFPNIL